MTAPALDQPFEVAGGEQPAELATALAWAATQPQIDLLDGKPPPDARPAAGWAEAAAAAHPGRRRPRDRGGHRPHRAHRHRR